MKTICIRLISFIIIMSTICSNIYALEVLDVNDSSVIPDEVMDIIQPENGDEVIKCYNMHIGITIRKYDDIDQILEAQTERNILYFKVNDTELATYCKDSPLGYYKIEEQIEHKDAPGIQQWLSSEAIHAVSPDIIIQSRYYLYGKANYSGTAIYYKTNLGDFVYFNYYDIDCLFAADIFKDYQEAVHIIDVAKANGELLVGESSFDALDLSAYNYRSSSFNPYTPIPEIKTENPAAPDLTIYFILGGSALILIGVGTFLIIHAKKKKKKEEEIPEDK